MKGLTIFISVTLVILALCLLVSAITSEKLSFRLDRLEKAMEKFQNSPQRIEIKYVK